MSQNDFDDFEKELKYGFIEESETLLEEAEQALLDLENQSNQMEIINHLFRVAHNIKGTARAVGFGDLAEFTHSIESLILKIKESEIGVSDNVISVLLSSFDEIRKAIGELKNDPCASTHFEEATHKIIQLSNSEVNGYRSPDEIGPEQRIATISEQSSPELPEDESAFIDMEDGSEEFDLSDLDETTDDFEIDLSNLDKIDSTDIVSTSISEGEPDPYRPLKQPTPPSAMTEEDSPLPVRKQAYAESLDQEPRAPQHFESIAHPTESELNRIFSNDAETDSNLVQNELKFESKSNTKQMSMAGSQQKERKKEKSDEAIVISDKNAPTKAKVMESPATETDAVSESLEMSSSAKEVDHIVNQISKQQQNLEETIRNSESDSPPSNPERVQSSSTSQQKSTGSGCVEETLRVKLSRLEALNNYAGELVIIQSVLAQHQNEVRSQLVIKTLNQLSKLSKEIQELSMSLRMVPLRPTLQKMQRIVRDTSKALSKKVDLELIGSETEIDKTILEKLNDPLTHIVRNAVDHGIESPENRVSLGKNETGKITISCFHESNNLVIEIKDDGQGLNPQKLKMKAIEKGLTSKDSNLTDEETFHLIFHPGFSTKEEVTEVSGRGVGMDVVHTNIKELNGSVSLTSESGEGSTFKIILPLTMAVIDGMITQVGPEKYVFPISQVHETVRPCDGQITEITGLGRVLSLRGENIPLKSVAKELNRPFKETHSIEKQIAVIVESNGSKAALLVDDIYHQQQVVVKSLGEEIENKNGFVGSSILGNGLPAFILDLHTIAIPKINEFQNGLRRSA
ncbi:MAG: chemotaxis protein CheA [Bdellovibrionales bacterium]|nr:chemotaxis protein CheA [Bdellovibrionales bacterium]